MSGDQLGHRKYRNMINGETKKSKRRLVDIKSWKKAWLEVTYKN